MIFDNIKYSVIIYSLCHENFFNIKSEIKHFDNYKLKICAKNIQKYDLPSFIGKI